MICKTLPQEVSQIRRALSQGRGPALGRLLVSPIFNFDADRPSVAAVAERGKKLPPIDVAETRQLWAMILQRRGQDAHVVEPAAIEPHVFGMDVDEPVGK